MLLLEDMLLGRTPMGDSRYGEVSSGGKQVVISHDNTSEPYGQDRRDGTMEVGEIEAPLTPPKDRGLSS